MDPIEEVDITLQRALQFYLNGEDNVMFSYYNPLNPVLQEGPSCGIVALSMATQLVSENSICKEYILRKAQELKFTISGEMFCTENMGKLTEIICTCKVQIIQDLVHQKTNIVNHILNGGVLLIPYDTDRNHVPCVRNGQYAHWAIISGICLAIPYSLLSGSYTKLEICHTQDGKDLKKYVGQAELILVYSHHGKSKHLQCWDLEELLMSNANLFEMHNKHDVSNMILPDGDMLSGLRNKALLLTKLV